MSIDFKLDSTLENDVLWVKVTGNIKSITDWQNLVHMYYKAYEPYGVENVILDQSDLDFPIDFFHMMEITRYYSNELPFDIRLVNVAVVVKEKYLELGEFWETYSHNGGFPFKIFYSLESARQYISKVRSPVVKASNK